MQQLSQEITADHADTGDSGNFIALFEYAQVGKVLDKTSCAMQIWFTYLQGRQVVDYYGNATLLMQASFRDRQRERICNVPAARLGRLVQSPRDPASAEFVGKERIILVQNPDRW